MKLEADYETETTHLTMPKNQIRASFWQYSLESVKKSLPDKTEGSRPPLKLRSHNLSASLNKLPDVAEAAPTALPSPLILTTCFREGHPISAFGIAWWRLSTGFLYTTQHLLISLFAARVHFCYFVILSDGLFTCIGKNTENNCVFSFSSILKTLKIFNSGKERKH